MFQRLPWVLALAVCAIAIAVGCGSDPELPGVPIDAAGLDGSGGGADALDTTPIDAPDTPTPDSGPDAGDPDTPPDVAPDGPPDATPDGGPDDVAPDLPELGELGEDCVSNSECESALCVPVDEERNVCSGPCAGADDCPAGWECDDTAGACLCSAGPEVCNGRDDDCDAEIDEGTAEELGCGPFETCVDDACFCPGDECEGVCTNLIADPLNCGACGTVCDLGLHCIDADCICPEDFAICDGLCTDTASDDANCGDCGNACPEDRQCREGECVCPGEMGAICFDECVDAAIDIDNCGGCGFRCNVGQVCDGGECGCRRDQLLCDRVCVDFLIDSTNCGACGGTCAEDEVCSEGECVCSGGRERCDGVCVDTGSDPSHCGGCGLACAPEEPCGGGVCGCEADTLGCADGCIDPLTDRDNCGGCDNACGDLEICDGGECACACGDEHCDDGLCFVLPFEGLAESVDLTFTPDTQAADIAVSMDTTGSMGGEIEALRTSFSSDIVPLVAAVFPDTAFSVSEFADFPCGSYGGGDDLPFELRQAVTTDITAVQAAINAMSAAGGGDFPESGFEALYQLATGAGRTFDCGSGGEIPALDPSAGLGGVGFRDGSLPIVLHVTDAQSHARGESSYPLGATREEAYEALDDLGARVIGIASGGEARSHLVEVATETDTRVLPCAWGEARPPDCSPEQCCTQNAGRGRAPDDEGLCPLVFDISGSGAGLDDSVVAGVQVLSLFAPFDVRLRVRRDDDTFASSGVDTTCFVTGVEAIEAGAVPGGCGFDPAPAPPGDDGRVDGFVDVTAGTPLTFGITAQNGCVGPEVEQRLFPIHVDVVAGEAASFASVTLYVYVPR